MTPHPKLTPRQLETAQAASRGTPNKQIAEDMGITVYAVKLHLVRAYKRLGVSARKELAAVLEREREAA